MNLRGMFVLFWSVLCFVTLWAACGPATSPPEETTPSQEQTSDGGSEPATSPDSSKTPDTTTPEPAIEKVAEPIVEKAAEPVPEPGPKDTAPRKTEFGGSRPVTLKVPDGYDHSKPTPLLIVLHGYGATGAVQSFYLGVNALFERENILMAAPDGTKDASGKQFWNATDACCDFGGTKVDDVGYLRTLIEDIQAEYNVDPKRIYLMGHSNGGFMSYRMACEISSKIAAIVSIAGATFADKSKCNPTEPPSVLQIHGTADTTVKYPGETISGVSYPGAEQTVATWGEYHKCTGALGQSTGQLDIEGKIAGAETDVRSIEGCPTGHEVTLWTIKDGGHVPGFATDFADQAWKWMKAHPKSP